MTGMTCWIIGVDPEINTLAIIKADDIFSRWFAPLGHGGTGYLCSSQHHHHLYLYRSVCILMRASSIICYNNTMYSLGDSHYIHYKDRVG